MAYFTVHSSTFILPELYAHGPQPGEPNILDINGDGNLDILVTYSIGGGPEESAFGPVQVLLGDGLGGLTDGTSAVFGSTVPETSVPREVILADFNGDGRNDVYIADHGEDYAPHAGAPDSLYLSSGATGFVDASANLSGPSDFTHSGAVGDIDGDGDLDIFAGNQHSSPLFYINDGAGDFTIATDRLPDPFYAGSTNAFLDADDDGDLDMFVGYTGDLGLVVLTNDGDGNFSLIWDALPLFPLVSEGSSDSLIFDFNDDGLDDVLVVSGIAGDNGTSIKLQVLVSNGDGSFVDETLARIPDQAFAWLPNRVESYDINGDGHLDLIASSGGDTPLYMNDGTGHFIRLPAGYINVPFTMFDRVTATDMNNDGRTDFVITWLLHGAPDEPPANYDIAIGIDPGALHTGDAGANALLGDSSNETLNGAGGADVLFGAQGNDTMNGGNGSDVMVGGAGNDVYVVGTLADVVTEHFNQGTDRIESSITLTLSANLENMTLTGAAVISGTGNTASNTLIGNTAANTLSGLDGHDTLSGAGGDDILLGGNGNDTLNGGVAHDRLTGGAGADKFVFNAAVAAAHSDTITDFVHASDKIQLENSVFTALGAAATKLAVAKFFVGVDAHDANDRIIYNPANGQLFYDANGNAAGQKVLIARLDASLTITASDFQVI